MKPKTTRELRRGNLTTLLRLIYFHEPINRQELSRRSGLSPATVTNLVTQMVEQGLVEQAGIEQSNGGRPREILRIRGEFGYFIGVEVAETQIHSELYDLRLNSRARVHYEITPDTNSPEAVAECVAASIRELEAAAAVTNAEIFAAGVGLPGIVQTVEGVSVFAPNWGWKNVPLRAMLNERLDIQFQIDNGMRGLSLAEALFGAGRGVKDLIVVLLGTGVAAGLITGHQLWRGASNSAGEWGHTCLDKDGPLCRCDHRGCVESYVGAPAIIRRLEEADPVSPLLQAGGQKDVVTALTAEALQGNPVAEAILDDVTLYLGLGIANLVNMFNPSRVVVGGWCGQVLAPYVLPQLPQVVRKYALSEPARIVEFRVSEMDERGVSLGAACLVLETFLAGELLSLVDSPVIG